MIEHLPQNARVRSESGVTRKDRRIIRKSALCTINRSDPRLKCGRSGTLILVVDDNSDMREIVCLALEQGGYPAAGASNGEEAMAWLHCQAVPGAILLDLTMPIMNG